MHTRNYCYVFIQHTSCSGMMGSLSNFCPLNYALHYLLIVVVDDECVSYHICSTDTVTYCIVACLSTMFYHYQVGLSMHAVASTLAVAGTLTVASCGTSPLYIGYIAAHQGIVLLFCFALIAQ